ncbi:MAG TPA: heme o synthase [Polyangiales bacterium]
MNTAAATTGFVPTFRDLVALTKPRVTALVLATSGAGMALAPGALPVGRGCLMLLGTLLCVASANALNCFLERESDKLMARTRTRPLPAGRLEPSLALGFGLLLGALSLPVLALGVNPVTGALGALALVSYVAVYTPMKTMSPLALVVGAVPGALPPLMGWTAVTGHIAAFGLVLFAILFLWQLPHVIGLGSFRRDDYVAAGIRVLPAVYGERFVKTHAVIWTLVLCGASVLPTVFGWAGPGYLITALLLGGAYLAATLRGFRTTPLSSWGKRLFLTSLFYLPFLFLALILDGRA